MNSEFKKMDPHICFTSNLTSAKQSSFWNLQLNAINAQFY